jgi:hypothetical protein
MQKLVDVLLGAAVLAFLAALGFRFLSPDMGFNLASSFVTPLFLWRGAIGLLAVAAVLLLRQIRDESPSRKHALQNSEVAVSKRT